MDLFLLVFHYRFIVHEELEKGRSIKKFAVKMIEQKCHWCRPGADQIKFLAGGLPFYFLHFTINREELLFSCKSQGNRVIDENCRLEGVFTINHFIEMVDRKYCYSLSFSN